MPERTDISTILIIGAGPTVSSPPPPQGGRGHPLSSVFSVVNK